jgi:hypothetical protein
MTMHSIRQQVANAIAALPETAELDDILAVVEKYRSTELHMKLRHTAQPIKPSRSFSEAAHKYAGCVPDAPDDLSSNPA